MRALLAGERRASVGVVLGLIGILCLLGVSTGLAVYGMTNLHALRETLQERCAARQAIDQANHNGQVANAEAWKSLAEIAESVKLPPGTDPEMVRLYNRQKAVLNTAKVQAQAAADAGVIGTCTVYK